MRGLRIGILYELKDKLSGGLNRIKERMGQMNELQQRAKLKSKEYFDSFTKGAKESLPALDNFKLKNMEIFDAIQDQVPFLGRLGGLLSNPYVLAIGAAVGLATATVKLGQEMFRVSEQIEMNQRAVSSTFQITGRELDDTTARVMAITSVLKTEIKDLTGAANAMHREYADAGVGISDSLNHIKLGLLATNGQLDLQEIKEYASQMKAANVSAEGLVAIAVKGRKEGVFSDKALDAVKEFNLRVKEMTPAAAQALQGIGLSGEVILKQLDSGSKGVLDVLRDVSGAMRNANTQARQTAIADLFGGAGEDAGQRFLLSLATANLNLKEMIDLSDPLIARQVKRLALEEKIAKAQGDSAGYFNDLRHSYEDFVGGIKLGLFDTMSKLFGSDQRQLRLFDEQSNMVKNLTNNLNPLLNEMELLQGKTSLSADEQTRLRDVIQQIADLTPTAVSKWDQYGNAIEISTGKAKDFLALQKEIMKVQNQDAIESLRKTISTNDFRNSKDLIQLRTGKKAKTIAGQNSLSQSDDLNPEDIQRLKGEIRKKNIMSAQALLRIQELGGDLSDQDLKFLKDLNMQVGGNSINPPGGNEEPNGNGKPGGSTTSIAEQIASKSVQQRNVTVHIQNLNEGGITVQSQTVQESTMDIKDALTEMLIEAVRNAEEAL